MVVSRMRSKKIRYIALIYGGIAEIPARIQEIGVEEHDSDVRR